MMSYSWTVVAHSWIVRRTLSSPYGMTAFLGISALANSKLPRSGSLNFNVYTQMKVSAIVCTIHGDTATDAFDNLDVVLSLADKKGNPSAGQLSLRIKEESASTVAGDAVEQAQSSAQVLSLPLVRNVSDGVTSISNAWSNQQNLITTFDALMTHLGLLVKIGDEVAKVCSLVSSHL
jgi:hypothetical protein